MRKIVLWFSSTAATVVVLFGYHTSTQGVAATAQQPIGSSLATTSTTTTSGTGPDTGTSSSGSATAGTGATASASASAEKTVTGDVVQTQWGPVQVQVTTAGGQLTAVNVIQYPSGNGRDVEINNYALPVLVDETLSAQSASIDMVSGATVTSVGYLSSLQSALDQAGL